MLDTWSVLCAGLLVALCSYLASFKSFPKNLPVPPGPRPLPFIGNALQMPSGASWKAFAEWGKTYGTLFPTSASFRMLTIFHREDHVRSSLWQQTHRLELGQNRTRTPRQEERQLLLQTKVHNG